MYFIVLFLFLLDSLGQYFFFNFVCFYYIELRERFYNQWILYLGDGLFALSNIKDLLLHELHVGESNVSFMLGGRNRFNHCIIYLEIRL